MPSSATGSDLESMPGIVLENLHRGVLGSVLGVYLGASREITWECTVKQAGSVPSSAVGSVLESMPGSELENVLGGVLGSVLRVYLGAS